MRRSLTVIQILPALDIGGVERGTVEIAKALKTHGHHPIVVAEGGRMAQELTQADITHINWPVGHKRPWSLRLVPRLRALFAQADIVHVRSRLPAWLAYLAWRGMPEHARPRFISTVHGPYSVNRYSAVMMRCERIIAISEFIREYILSNYPHVSDTRVTVIHRGIDRSTYPHGFTPSPTWQANWRQEYPQLIGKQLVILPARLTRWKGQEDLIEVIARLKKIVTKPVHGIIVGGFHPRRSGYVEALRARVAELGSESDISFLGHRTDLREILASAALSLSLAKAPEAFGRTTIEALSLGTPVVGYDHGGTGEILQNLYPQGLTPCDDLDALTTTMAKILAHADPVPKDHPFLLHNMIDKTLELYVKAAATIGSKRC